MGVIANFCQPKVAFVFAGGGSLGAVQVGMLRALLESDIHADLVVGSSVGAINAAYFAGDPTLTGVSQLETVWRNLKRADILPLSWRRLFRFLHRRDHLVASDGLMRLLDHHLPYRSLEEARLPVHVVATDVLSGDAVVLSRGSATRAILASSAIPAAFAPVEIDGRILCDGAIASNTPVRAAVVHGARRLIVLPTGFESRPKRPPDGAIASALNAIAQLTTRQLTLDLDHLKEAADCHVLPNACPPGVSPFDFSRTPELIERAYDSTMQWVRSGGLERKGKPNIRRRFTSAAGRGVKKLSFGVAANSRSSAAMGGALAT